MVSPQKGSWRQPAQGCKTSSGRLPCTDRSGAKTAKRPLFDLEQTMTAENHSPPARSLRRTQCTNLWVVYNCALSKNSDRAHYPRFPIIRSNSQSCRYERLSKKLPRIIIYEKSNCHFKNYQRQRCDLPNYLG